MSAIDILGFVAAVGTTGAFIPQAFKVFKTKKTNDLSLGTFLLLNFGIIMWEIYGIIVNSLPIILANAITFIMSFYILVMIIKHKRQ
ncbi:MAG: SemiSWEET transporter [Ignavibacteriales bacterium]|nr:SemiSWEET transporter [Ignavibacteriales bacterium]